MAQGKPFHPDPVARCLVSVELLAFLIHEQWQRSGKLLGSWAPRCPWMPWASHASAQPSSSTFRSAWEAHLISAFLKSVQILRREFGMAQGLDTHIVVNTAQCVFKAIIKPVGSPDKNVMSTLQKA